jgi:ElaB/YqjD/DUF883 family membrane-anchored ribosome-binding protein
MGLLDNLKDKAEDFGEKAKEGFEAAKDKASDLIDDVKDRFDKDEDDKTSEEKVDEALNYDPSAVDAASEEGISGAAAGVEPTLEPDSSVDRLAPAPDPMSPASDPMAPTAESMAPTQAPDNAYDVADDFEPTPEPAAESMAPTQAPDDAYDVAEDFEPTPEPAAEPMEPTQTPDEAYDAALDDAAAKSEYRSDSTP